MSYSCSILLALEVILVACKLLYVVFFLYQVISLVVLVKRTAHAATMTKLVKKK